MTQKLHDGGSPSLRQILEASRIEEHAAIDRACEAARKAEHASIDKHTDALKRKVTIIIFAGCFAIIVLQTLLHLLWDHFR